MQAVHVEEPGALFQSYVDLEVMEDNRKWWRETNLASSSFSLN
jgi:hypothetical protein